MHHLNFCTLLLITTLQEPNRLPPRLPVHQTARASACRAVHDGATEGRLRYCGEGDSGWVVFSLSVSLSLSLSLSVSLCLSLGLGTSSSLYFQPSPVSVSVRRGNASTSPRPCARRRCPTFSRMRFVVCTVDCCTLN